MTTPYQQEMARARRERHVDDAGRALLVHLQREPGPIALRVLARQARVPANLASPAVRRLEAEHVVVVETVNGKTLVSLATKPEGGA
jgi:hypothetical protein